MIKFSGFTYQLSYYNNINLAILRIKFSRLTKNPRNPRKLEPSKYSGYTVIFVSNFIANRILLFFETIVFDLFIGAVGLG